MLRLLQELLLQELRAADIIKLRAELPVWVLQVQALPVQVQRVQV